MKRLLIASAIALLLIGCSTERQCARAAKKCAHLWHTDTAYVHDSVTIERTLIDTLLRWQTLTERDTVTIRDGRATVRIVRLPGDSIWVQGECGDTVIRYVRQMVTNRIEQPDKWDSKWFRLFIAGWATGTGILLARFILWIIRRRKN